jgi:hypothetical protein
VPVTLTREAALPVFLGDRCATHKVDDRRGVEHRVDAVDGRGNDVGVTYVALDHLESRMGGQRRRGPVEGAHLVSTVQQLGHQIGADETGAAGHQHTAKIGGQR